MPQFLLTLILRQGAYNTSLCIEHMEESSGTRNPMASEAFGAHPDFAIYRRQGKPSIVVCTKQANVNDSQHLPKWTATQLWCEKYGYEFTLVTEVVLLRYQPLLSNLKSLTVHAYRTLPPQAYKYLM